MMIHFYMKYVSLMVCIITIIRTSGMLKEISLAMEESNFVLADSLSMHMNSLTGKRIKDHNASMAISSVQRVQRHIAQSIIKP